MGNIIPSYYRLEQCTIFSFVFKIARFAVVSPFSKIVLLPKTMADFVNAKAAEYQEFQTSELPWIYLFCFSYCSLI